MSAAHSHSECNSISSQSIPFPQEYPMTARPTSKGPDLQEPGRKSTQYSPLIYNKGSSAGQHQVQRSPQPHIQELQLSLCLQKSYLTACLKLLLVPPHESTSNSLALGPCRQGTLSLRSKERDAPFHNFSKSQGSQQSHSHLGCAWALPSGQLTGHSPKAEHSVLSLFKSTSSFDRNGNQSPQVTTQRRIHSNHKRKDTEMMLQ